MTVNTREFQRVAEALYATSSRTMPQFCNGQMFKVATEAIKFTEKADRVRIEQTMGTLSKVETLRGGKDGAKGWVRISKRKMSEASVAARIINARAKAEGKPMLWGQPLIEAARKMVAAKVRSVGFIKSGWIPAVRTLAKLVYARGASLDGARQKGVPKGYAVPAKVTFNGVVSCEIGNTALLPLGRHSTWHGKPGNPMPIAEAGLRLALRSASQDMAREFYKRMGEDLKPYGVTVT